MWNFLPLYAKIKITLRTFKQMQKWQFIMIVEGNLKRGVSSWRLYWQQSWLLCPPTVCHWVPVEVDAVWLQVRKANFKSSKVLFKFVLWMEEGSLTLEPAVGTSRFVFSRYLNAFGRTFSLGVWMPLLSRSRSVCSVPRYPLCSFIVHLLNICYMPDTGLSYRH